METKGSCIGAVFVQLIWDDIALMQKVKLDSSICKCKVEVTPFQHKSSHRSPSRFSPTSFSHLSLALSRSGIDKLSVRASYTLEIILNNIGQVGKNFDLSDFALNLWRPSIMDQL